MSVTTIRLRCHTSTTLLACLAPCAKTPALTQLHWPAGHLSRHPSPARTFTTSSCTCAFTTASRRPPALSRRPRVPHGVILRPSTSRLHRRDSFCAVLHHHDFLLHNHDVLHRRNVLLRPSSLPRCPCAPSRRPVPSRRPSAPFCINHALHRHIVLLRPSSLPRRPCAPSRRPPAPSRLPSAPFCIITTSYTITTCCSITTSSYTITT